MRYFLLLLASIVVSGHSRAKTLDEQNEALFANIKKVHNLTDDQMKQIRAIFSKSGYIGQGNPAITEHPLTPEQCREKVKKAGVTYENEEFEKICKAKYMAPLYNPKKQKQAEATTCIDQFEFPDIPCDYPVVWVRTKEAAEICHVMGKTLCDAHEWEGACAGSLEEPDYDFSLAKKMGETAALKTMRAKRNREIAKNKTWAYGKNFKKGICAQDSFKHNKCNGGNWKECGSNTYPSGSFPDCRSTLQVYDQHGNAAEHMSIPVKPEQMATASPLTYGHTEMKGSWFIWDKFQAHKDYCRWRAPYWHGSRVMDEKSHHNYHLGFRCCKHL